MARNPFLIGSDRYRQRQAQLDAEAADARAAEFAHLTGAPPKSAAAETAHEAAERRKIEYADLITACRAAGSPGGRFAHLNEPQVAGAAEVEISNIIALQRQAHGLEPVPLTGTAAAIVEIAAAVREPGGPVREMPDINSLAGRILAAGRKRRNQTT